MRLQDHMIEVTRDAMNEAFKYAAKAPEDKLDWSPLGAGRSILDQCRELAMCPTWCLDIISDQPQPEWNEESVAAMRAEQAQWKTVADCKAECERKLEILFTHFQQMPDEDLVKTKWLPYGGGRDFTMPEMMDYPRWNFTYHLGQIAYIQTLYGDKDMY